MGVEGNDFVNKVVVVGGGASGMLCAIYASLKNEVTILEKNNVVGKKITITGNGKCNYYNDDQRLFHYHSTKLESIMCEKNLSNILDFFDAIGIVPRIKDGYYYPYSNTAFSVREALEKECILRGIEIITDYEVNSIEKVDNFIINNDIVCDKVVLACGSLASKFGSDIGYELASSLGHNIIPVNPALCGISCKNDYFKEWSGIRSFVKISAYVDGKFEREEDGEIQLTDYGISGICTFNLSYLVSKYNDVKFSINFLPFASNLEKFLDDRSEKVTGRNMVEFLEGILDYKLVKVILKKAQINNNKYFDELTKREKHDLIRFLGSYEVFAEGVTSFNKAQVCTGGVSLDEVDLNTMESKLVSGLYVTGELLDVDCDCGGYNLSFAFVSGMIAGMNICD